MTDEQEPGGAEGAFDEMEFDMSELIPEYLSGARENVAAITDGLLALEKNPGDDEALFDVFRRAHGMKGSANMIGFVQIAELTHHLEEFLKNFHESKKPLTASANDIALSVVDLLSLLLDGLEKDGSFSTDIASAVGAMEQFDFDALIPSAVPVKSSAADASASVKELHDSIRIHVEKANELMMLAGNLLSAKELMKEHLVALGGPARGRYLTPEKVADLYGKLNAAGNLMGRAVDEMRHAILDIRLTPVATLFHGFPRLVRDLSRRLGKEIEYADEGGNTLLDRQIIEEMNEPLVHMVRNAIDHGIEPGDERERAGKGRAGSIRLSARNEQGKIVIALSDDGGGIDAMRVKQKALAKGLITEETAETMSEKELRELVCVPGFSTRDEATDVSGRGVGMDAVKTAVEKLQGTLEIESEKGLGTTVTVNLPLTVASTRAVLIVVADITIGIPSAFVHRVLRADRDQVRMEEGSRTLRLRGDTLPLHCFDAVMMHDNVPFPDADKTTVLVLEVAGLRTAFAVGAIVSEAELFVKPLPDNIQNADLWVGAAQMSTGEVVPILNVHSMLRSCAA